MPANRAPVRCNPKIAALRNAAFFVLGATAMVLAGCAPSTDSLLFGEKIYDPTATGPTYATDLPKPPSPPVKETHQFTEDERAAQDNTLDNVILFRPFRNADGTVYTKDGVEQYIGKYLPKDDNGRVSVVFFSRPVPIEQAAYAKRLLCSRKACGPVPLETAHIFEAEYRDLLVKTEKMKDAQDKMETAQAIKGRSGQRFQNIVGEIKVGEDELKRLGVTLPSRIEVLSRQ